MGLGCMTKIHKEFLKSFKETFYPGNLFSCFFSMLLVFTTLSVDLIHTHAHRHTHTHIYKFIIYSMILENYDLCPL